MNGKLPSRDFQLGFSFWMSLIMAFIMSGIITYVSTGAGSIFWSDVARLSLGLDAGFPAGPASGTTSERTGGNIRGLTLAGNKKSRVA